MSRSIHTTVHQWAEIGCWDFADAERKQAQRGRLFGQLLKKRRVTRRVIAERRAADAEHWPAPVETVPIGVEDAGPYVHYPAGPDDLRAIMGRLPPGVLDGLERIDLQLGAEAQLAYVNDRDACDLAPDPYVGRLGGVFAEGVYKAHVTGQYDPQTARIFVFGYVYDPTLADREVVEFAVRYYMLKTFVHEVAHHDDHMRRTARGRWLADDKKKTEIYAQAGARTWVQSCIRPYLRETYTDLIEPVLAWSEAQLER